MKKLRLYLHHFQLVRIGEIARRRLVAGDVSLNVNMCPIDKALLYIFQHLLDTSCKCTQLFS